MPINYNRYPKNWHEFSRRIRFERAKNRCEKCNVPNYAVGFRSGDSFEYFGGSLYLDETARGKNGYTESKALHQHLLDAGDGDERRPTLVILTVAHLDNFGDVCDCEEKTGAKCAIDDHVLALCQKCHLTYDGERHKFNARRTRAEKSGQMWLGDWDARFEAK